MSDDSFSEEDMEAGDVGEGACVRVVQSSLHASIMQSSLFKVIEKRQESEDEKSEQTPPLILPEDPQNPSQNIEENLDLQPKNEPIGIPESGATEIKHDQQLKESSPILIEALSEKIVSPKGERLRTVTSSHLLEIFDEIPKKPRKNYKEIDVQRRFYEYKTKVNQKVAVLKEEKEAKEAEICTFQPKVIRDQKEPRSFTNFLNHMSAVNEAHQKALEKLQTEKIEEEQLQKSKLFKPTLSKATLKLASKHKSSVSLHTKLHNEYKELQKKKSAESEAVLKSLCPFTPVLEKRSVDLKREGLATENLYKAALAKQSKPLPLPERKSEKLISEYSESLAKEKFLKEVAKHLIGLEEGLNFEEFFQVLEKCGFVHEFESNKFEKDQKISKKAWEMLGGTENCKVLCDATKEFLLGVMNLVKPEGLQKCGFVEFRRFYENRRDRVAKKTVQTCETFAFVPEINSYSLELAQVVKGKRINEYSTDKPEKVFKLLEEQVKKKVSEHREALSNKGMENCTFHPKTLRGPVSSEEQWLDSESLVSDYLRLLSERQTHRCEALFTFSKVEQERKEREMRSVDDADIEKNMNECTFAPNLEKKPVKNEKTCKKERKKWKEKRDPKANVKADDLNLYSDESQSCLGETIKQLLKLDNSVA